MSIHVKRPTEVELDIDWLGQMADQREAIKDKIDRALWCLNLHLLDGFDREELDALQAEVEKFTIDCRTIPWRRK
jgi:hypothetical protein